MLCLRGGGEASLHSLLTHVNYSFIVPWTHHELSQQIELMDLHLLGVASGDCIVLLIPNGSHAALCLVAAMQQYCVVPLDPSLPADNIAAALTRLQPRCIISPAGEKVTLASRQSGIPHRVLQLTEAKSDTLDSIVSSSTPASRHTGVLLASSDHVLVLQTSGTTSEPKLVPFSLRRLVASGQALAESMQLSTEDVGLNVMPLHHVGGIACNLMAPLVAGSRMVYAAWSEPSAWYAFVERRKWAVTWCYAAPAIWSQLTRHGEAMDHTRQHAMRLLRSGAAPLPHVEAKRLAALFGERACVLPTYSMTVRSPTSKKLPRSLAHTLGSDSVDACAGVHAHRLPAAGLHA